ncbi:Alpha/Beta hydrolase protein [Stachybotrys elegans]|uniref:Carboxypeptidase n=1 Tax=Stachybotrys elegans TaxID=80388 RepID=A0A8K0WU16_9HYPO|nr:Alpha/Beta hydrolase protein [Stachybotrys elegans]
MWASAAVLGGLATAVLAQFPPEPEGVTVLKSRFHENVTISYKEPGICETTPGVKSYAGYIHLPPGFLNDASGEAQDYPVNTFFWFFEARKNPATAPLAIWLNGGPGGSSMLGLLQENGPCMVAQDSKSTVLNPWSWNNEVNMLYIDEPNQVGFSYDVPTNCTQVFTSPDLTGNVITPADFSDGLPDLNITSMVGTFSSQNISHTPNSTAQAGHALWHFAQTWFFEFPFYKPADDRISLWAESYGGHYGPGFMRFFQEQNEKIANGTIQVDNAHYLHLDTLGIVNGYLDALEQAEAAITFAYNNTYGIQVFNQSLYEELMHNFTVPGGCRDQLRSCQDKLILTGSRPVTLKAASQDAICDLESWCAEGAEDIYLGMSRSWFDIAHQSADPFPPPYYNGYLLEESVLQALGTPINFTWVSGAVATGFGNALDPLRGGFIDAVGYLLDSGVKVHMMYGDRDYACNWVGGERVSLEVPYRHTDDFANAGYAPLLTTQGVKGMTRQYGNYSFTRVFQAGHEVPAYQPEAAYEIFMRATFNRDIPTGYVAHQERPPEMPSPLCYVLAPWTCEPEVWRKVFEGAAKVENWIVVGIDGDDELEFGESSPNGQFVVDEL